MKERAVTATELAQMLGISRSKLYRLIQEPGFPYLRVGAMYRFWPDDVIAFLAVLPEDVRSRLATR